MRAEDLPIHELTHLDADTGLPMFYGYRIIGMGMASLNRLKADLTHGLGEAKMDVVAARFGYEIGMALAKVMDEHHRFSSIAERLRAGTRVFTAAGYAVPTIETVSGSPHDDSLRLSGRWEASFEVLGWQASHTAASDKPICRMLTGILSGYASTVFGSDVLIREVSCQAEGHDFCTFQGGTATQWGLDPERLRRQYALKPLGEELARLEAELAKARDLVARQQVELNRFRRSPGEALEDEGIVYRSDRMRRLLALARRVAATSATVLIEGESGAGKERMARYIHRHSDNADAPLLAVNCAALPATLLESELFGHVKGAFTGADTPGDGLFVAAGRGTLLLDEITELPMMLQAKLLRVLEEREVRPVGGTRHRKVHARIVAITNTRLKARVREGQFREDLYYRLAVFPLSVPPLRDRREDILVLARRFLDILAPDHPGFTADAVRRMEAHRWPGNVRELRNWIEYASVLAGTQKIDVRHLPEHRPAGSAAPLPFSIEDLPTQHELLRRYTRAVLTHTGGNKAHAARIMGISPTTLWRHLKQTDPPGRPADDAFMRTRPKAGRNIP